MKRYSVDELETGRGGERDRKVPGELRPVDSGPVGIARTEETGWGRLWRRLTLRGEETHGADVEAGVNEPLLGNRDDGRGDDDDS